MVHFAPVDGHASDLPGGEDALSIIVPPRPAGQMVARPAEPSHLSSLEQSVVALSLFDGCATAAAPCLLSRVLSRLFGIEPPNRLASRRLEALRCYSIIARETGGCPEASKAAQLIGSGFSEVQIQEINRLVARGSTAIHMKSWSQGGDDHVA